MVWNCVKNRIIGLLLIAFIVSLHPGNGSCGTPPKQGENLPEISLISPASNQEIAYLGIGEKSQFVIKDVDAPLIVIEIMGVYCPVCHKQRPHINRLFHQINKNTGLSGKIKFLGIAAGATPMEVAYYIKQSKVPYPVLPDEKFVIHKRLGEPLTPYNMVVTKEGEILFAHLGIIEDMNGFFKILKALAGKTPTVGK